MVQRISRTSNRRCGFTLLELIIALALSSILMLLVWSLFSTYSRLEARSARTAIELQLVRSLSQQLRSDIAHFATQAVPPNVLTTHSELTDVVPVSTSDIGSFDNLESTLSQPSTNAEFSQPQPAVDEKRRRELLNSPREFSSTLPDQTYVRGNSRRLEIISRLPYTVDVPRDGQLIGTESRYGTHVVVTYQWHSAKPLERLLQEDPVLNPNRFRTPSIQANANLVQQQQQQQPPAAAPNPLNPNDNVGLIREAKSWLHVARDRNREDLKREFEAAGLLINGELPPLQRPQEAVASHVPLADSSLSAENDLRRNWSPPPEFRHKRDHVPEVTRLQFRYHDGDQWRLDWNDGRRLPAAIEVAFDLDPEAPSDRTQEFNVAHGRMAAGATLAEVLPEKLEEAEEKGPLEEEIDPLSQVNLEDPTAILTEYRFVIAIARTQVDLSEQSLSTSHEKLPGEVQP